MALEIVRCPFLLEVNYQTGIIHMDSGLTLAHPEWPPSRRWKRCLGQMAVFKFGERVSDREARQRIRAEGFMVGDIWCLSSLLKNWSHLKDRGFPLSSPVCIVAPATRIKSLGGSPFTYVWEEGERTIFFSAVKDWEGYWHSRWKFLAVRWFGVSRDDFWTPSYRPEYTLIEDRQVVFSDHLPYQ
jgi:hypothetical protein